jgi:hypothetical protein
VFDEYNSGSHYIKKDVSHPMGRDKSKVVARKGKGKASSSSQSDSESFGFGGGVVKSLRRVTKQFAKAQLCKQ